MQRRPLASTGIDFPAVTFGAWAGGGWDWGGADDAQTIRAIQAGIDHGMDAIDTATIYGAGHSETVVGKAIQGHREQVVIATKCGFRWDVEEGMLMEKRTPDGDVVQVRRRLTRESIRHEVEQSLRRLQVDVIDLYQCHAPDPGTPLEESMAALRELLDEGKVRAIGVSNFDAALLARSTELAPVASTQSMYNLVLRDIDRDILPFCRENNVGVLTYTSLLLGLLSGKVPPGREFPEGDVRRGHHLFTPEWRAAVAAMLGDFQPIADGHGCSLAQLAIAWVAATPGVTTALVGARSEAQAIENARAGAIKLSSEEHESMRQRADQLRAAMLGFTPE